MSKVEETPKATNPKHISSLVIKWKSLLAVLTIGVVILAGLSYTQYQSLNKISGEYGALQQTFDLVTKGALLQTEYNLRYGWYVLSNATENLTTLNVSTPPNNASTFVLIDGSSYCAVYTPYDGCTLDLFLFVCSISSRSYVTPTLQNGNVFDLGANETAPVIWSVNATATGEYSISLTSKGWYTVSLGGPMGPTTYPLMFRYTLECDCSASLMMMHEGTVSPFIVTTSRIP
jgi:hypothetical protein